MKQSSQPLRRTGLRRTPIRRWFRPEADKVSPSLHAYILNRDRICFAARIDPTHLCRDEFGNRHAPDDRKYLRLDHVKDSAQMGGPRAPSDRRHLLALCGDANNNGWASAHRNQERIYLAEVEPDE